MEAQPLPAIEKIEKDLDPAMGPFRFAGDVSIAGSIRERADVRTAGNISVGGTVEGATVEAGRDLHVHGGIVGRDHGRCAAGGRIICRFTSAANLNADGDIELEASMVQSHAQCRGKLKVLAGAISGGYASATGGITCKVLGASSAVKTIAEAGIDQRLMSAFRAVLPKLQLDRKKIMTVRERVAPLLQRQKSLTPAQKEKATELMYEADVLEESINATLADLRALRDSTPARPSAEIIVNDTVHAGTILRFAGLETSVKTAFKGPLTFAPRRVGASTEIVIIDGVSQAISPMPTVRLDDAELLALNALLGEGAANAA